MPVRVFTTEAEFCTLQPAWDELFESNPSNSPYQTWQWNFTWWRHFGRPRALRLLAAEERGRLIGLAPLYLAERFRGLPIRNLSFIARKRADYQDFLVRPGAEETFFRQVLTHLRDEVRDWSFIELRDLPESSPNLPVLRGEAARTLPLVSESADEICVSVPLQPTWPAFLDGLSKRFRKDICYYRRALERRFRTEFRVVESADEMRRSLSDLIAVYRARWQEDGGGAIRFDEQSSARFQREICELFTRAGRHRLYLLYADGKPAAGILAYVHNRKCYTEILAHAPEFHKYSVGTVLLSRAIEDAIANGWSEFDLMRGNEPYKQRWCGRTRHNHRIRLFRSRGACRVVSSVDWLCRRGASLERMVRTYRGAAVTRARIR